MKLIIPTLLTFWCVQSHVVISTSSIGNHIFEIAEGSLVRIIGLLALMVLFVIVFKVIETIVNYTIVK